MNAQAYIDICTQLRAKLATDYPELEIDIYNGQDEHPEKFDSYNMPFILIEFSPNDWVNNTDDTQEGLGGFKFRCVSPMISQDTRNIDEVPVEWQMDKLKMVNFPQAVHQAIQGFMPTGFSTPLERVGDMPDHNYDEKYVMEIHYTAIALDVTTGVYEQPDWEITQLTDVVVTPEVE